MVPISMAGEKNWLKSLWVMSNVKVFAMQNGWMDWLTRADRLNVVDDRDPDITHMGQLIM